MNWIASVCPSRPTLCTFPPYCGVPEKLTFWTASVDFLALWPLVGFGHWKTPQKTRGQVGVFVPWHPPCQATVGGLCPSMRGHSFCQVALFGEVLTPGSSSCSFHLSLQAQGGSHFPLFLSGLLHCPLWVSLYKSSF